MSGFSVIRKTDFPTPNRVRKASVRLDRRGSLWLSALVAEALGGEHCRMLAEFDPESRILKFTAAPEKLPRGLTEDDCFGCRMMKTSTAGARPQGLIVIASLLRYIGFRRNGNQSFEVVDLDPVERSLSLLLPAEQMESCEDSAH